MYEPSAIGDVWAYRLQKGKGESISEGIREYSSAFKHTRKPAVLWQMFTKSKAFYWIIDPSTNVEPCNMGEGSVLVVTQIIIGPSLPVTSAEKFVWVRSCKEKKSQISVQL